MGGYIASYALRAIGERPRSRPASFSCHYLSVAAFEDIDIVVTPLRTSRVAGSYRAEILQGDRRILEATGVGDRRRRRSARARRRGRAGRRRARRSEEHRRVLRRRAGRPARRSRSGTTSSAGRSTSARSGRRPEPLPPVWQQWIRFLEGDYSDPWVDACRALVLVDVQSWPAASKPHAYKQTRSTRRASTCTSRCIARRRASGCSPTATPPSAKAGCSAGPADCGTPIAG